MSLSSLKAFSDTTDGIIYEYNHAEDKFLEVNYFDIVQYLFSKGIFNDIECRKIVLSKNVVEIRAAIYDVIFTKDSKTVKKILEVFRNRLHSFQNPKILIRIFSYLKFVDLAKCLHVCPNWRQIIYCLLISKYDEVTLEQCLLMNLSEINKKIKLHSIEQNNDEEKASVFQLMLAMNHEKDEAMLGILEIGRGFPPETTDVSNSSMKAICCTEDEIANLTAKIRSNRTILTTVFQFLSLTDIKNCRIVCRTWNKVSEPCYRKISKIKFDSQFRPIDFLNISKYLPLPGLNFQAFKFRPQFYERTAQFWEERPMEGLHEFFTKFGKNIRSLDLCTLENLQPYLTCTSNFTELHLQIPTHSRRRLSSLHNPYIRIPWSKLNFIKILCLTNVVIEVESKKEGERITPMKLHLDKVIFFAGRYSSDVIVLNDYIDFTKVKDVNVHSSAAQTQQFDWSRDAFDAERVTFSETQFINTEKSKSAIHYFNLSGHYPVFGKNSTIIKQLMFREGVLPLTALPPSLEKLTVSGQNLRIVNPREEPILPNLNYLSYRKGTGLNLLSNFDNCLNLTDLEIMNMTSMDIRWLPRNVKRLKMKYHSGQLVTGGSPDEYLDLDLLILDYIKTCRLKSLRFDKLRPKFLILEIRGLYEDEEIVSFIRRNRNIDKMYLQFPPLPEHIVFSGSELSHMVDKESQYYEFSNELGKAITRQEFLLFQRSLDMLTAMKGFFMTEDGRPIHAQPGNFYNQFQPFANEDRR